MIMVLGASAVIRGSGATSLKSRKLVGSVAEMELSDGTNLQQQFYDGVFSMREPLESMRHGVRELGMMRWSNGFGMVARVFGICRCR